MNIFYVYEHWRPDTGVCFYVGKGKGRRAFNFRRKGHHANVLKKLASLGMAADVRLVASGLDEASAFRCEKERIAFWRSAGVALVNWTDGGEGLSNPRPEVRSKMVAALMGNKRAEGHKHSVEARAKMRESLARDDVRARMIVARKGKTPSLGMRHSEETRAKMSLSRVGRTHSEESRAKMRVSKKNISEETRIKMSLATKGRIASPQARANMSVARLGSVHTLEARAKMSASRTGKKRPQSVIDKMTGRKNSPETLKRMSAAAYRRYGTTPPPIPDSV